MPLLFSYGTLQQPAVQVATFGRTLAGKPDALPRFGTALVAIPDPARAAAAGRTHNVNAVRTGRDEDQLRGTVLEVSDAELAVADGYEAADAYRRVLVTLASGAAAWVYMYAGDGSGNRPQTT
jgi:gamma-glutamyl AIG2-like cyclotransferase